VPADPKARRLIDRIFTLPAHLTQPTFIRKYAQQ